MTICPGTVIKGRTGTGSLASALIVARDGKIEANGTADAPIIMTSVLDDVEPGQISGTVLTEVDNSKWGGFIVLGSAPTSADDGDTEAQIEGIPADEEYGRYGGDDANHSSGSITYVSVRFGGASIGAGNEINGITLGGIGAGTTVDYIEVVGNLDDGIECFGGNVNVSNVIVLNQGDDALDIDQNYAGTIDNAIIIMGSTGDEAIEIDGPEGSTYTDGKFTMTNCTFISTDGGGSGGDLKSKAQGTISNCVWEGFTSFLKIRANFDKNNACAAKSDAFSNLLAGDLVISDNDVVGSADPAEVATVYTGVDECAGEITQEIQDQVDAAVVAAGNAVVGSSSKGANTAAFAGWSWADANGKL